MAPACPPDVYSRAFCACDEEGGRGRWPGWVLIRDGGAGEEASGWIACASPATRFPFSSTRDAVGKKGETESGTSRHGVEGVAALEGGFWIGMVRCHVRSDCGLGSARAVFRTGRGFPCALLRERVAVLLLSFGESSILGFIRRGDEWSFTFCCWKEFDEMNFKK